VDTDNKRPDFEAFHRSVTAELDAVKDRVRNLVRDWPTDGGFKETVLISVLRRHLPESVIVGRGFIVTSEEHSTQVDILIVDARKPTLFKEGDLLIVTPDAVLGVIEVKTAMSDKTKISDALKKLSEVEKICYESTFRDSVWTGLFIYDGNERADQNGSVHKNLLGALGDAYHATNRPVKCISWGKDTFVRYWQEGSKVHSPIHGSVGHSYKLTDMAPSYFMGNLVDSLSSIDNQIAVFAWFPKLEGKETYRKYYLQRGETEPISFQANH
jgi:hypothetical protein